MKQKRKKLIKPEDLEPSESIFVEDEVSGKKVFLASSRYDVSQLLGFARNTFRQVFLKSRVRVGYIG